MQMYLYSVYDKKACFFASPFCVEREVMAERFFNELVCDPQSTISKYPDDFALYYLGEYDSSTGVVQCSDVPRFRFEAREYVKPSADAARVADSAAKATVPAAGEV